MKTFVVMTTTGMVPVSALSVEVRDGRLLWLHGEKESVAVFTDWLYVMIQTPEEPGN